MGRFIRERGGASRLVAALSVHLGYRLTTWTVYHWLSGLREPRPEHARALVELSGGRLTFSDLYGAERPAAAKTASVDPPGSTIAASRDSQHGGSE